MGGKDITPFAFRPLFPEIFFFFLAAIFSFPATLFLLKHFNANLDFKNNKENLQEDKFCLFSEGTKKHFFPPSSKQAGSTAVKNFLESSSVIFLTC